MNEKIEVTIGRLLRNRGWKLVVAESCTGGLIGHRITDIPGSSEYYLGSVTAYAYSAKERILGVHHETLLQHGAVSRETVQEMAYGIRLAFAGEEPLESIVGVAVTGIAGPGGATPEKPVGLVWIGISAPGLESAWFFVGQGNRQENKAFSAQMALELLLQVLEDGSQGETTAE